MNFHRCANTRSKTRGVTYSLTPQRGDHLPRLLATQTNLSGLELHMSEYHSFLWWHHCLWYEKATTHLLSSVDGHLGRFQCGAVRNSVTNILEHVSWYTHLTTSVGADTVEQLALRVAMGSIS